MEWKIKKGRGLLPWQYQKNTTNKGRPTYIISSGLGEDKYFVCETLCAYIADKRIVHFIVTACNSHYELIQAIESLIQCHGRVTKQSSDRWIKAQLALNKAKGEKGDIPSC